MSGKEIEELLHEVKEEKNEPPRVGYCPEPMKLKVALKFLEDGREVTRAELRDHLSSFDSVGEISSDSFGLVGRESNDLFEVREGEDRSADALSLTPRGVEIAEWFDDGAEELTAREKTLFRGLHHYASQFVFLGEIERHRQEKRQAGEEDNGILRADLEERMVSVYGGSGKYFTGYYATLFDRLDVIEKVQDGRQVRYRLAVPSSW
jgi:hypothetical protein